MCGWEPGLGERVPNVIQGGKSLSSDVHFVPLSTPASLPNLLFPLYCLVLSSLVCPVLSLQIDRTIGAQTNTHTHDLMKEMDRKLIVRDWNHKERNSLQPNLT